METGRDGGYSVVCKKEGAKAPKEREVGECIDGIVGEIDCILLVL